MREIFNLLPEQYVELQEASRPVRYALLGRRATPQDRVAAVWRRIGRVWGFDPVTVRPGRDALEFTAVVVPREEIA